MTELRIAVIADIHSDETGGDGTHVFAEPPAARPRQQPLADLVEFVRTEELKADYVIAAGDLANHANGVGLAYGWRKVQSLATTLEAVALGVPGNHDVVTHDYSADPRHALKALIPSFPSGDANIDAQFWARGWAIVEQLEHRVLLIDSTLDFPPHPGSVARDSEQWKGYLAAIDKGGFRIDVQDEISSAISGLHEKLNIAVLHHHPMEHQHHSWLQDHHGPMRRGSELIEVLSQSTTAGRWLIIHGHKHVPHLVSATATTTNGPIVLCGASTGAKLWHPVNTVARNQFHVITVKDGFFGTVQGLAGTIDSYTWGFGVGWQVSDRSGSGLPARTGFGSTEHFRVLSHHIEGALDGGGQAFLPYEDLVTAVPQLPYVLPSDWDFLESHLEAKGISFSRNRLNRIVQVSRSERRP